MLTNLSHTAGKRHKRAGKDENEWQEQLEIVITSRNGLNKIPKDPIRQHNVSSKDMLKNVLKDQWEKESAEKPARFISSMPKRLQEVYK
ncbi:hypothetical protein TNCV_805321 [Trichonephila clavipes]|nr:hypothetical protein TNCV_805321 [Trichonephila clavipes]